jgi:EmrB/QacA subfamily drug resistance transporter
MDTKETSLFTKLTVFTVALGTFMSSFDINAANIALPMIQSSFHTSIAIVEWVVVAYLLTLCSTQLTIGRISDLCGPKKIYTAGFVSFTVSSILCGISWNITSLIVFRILEAISAAMMASTSSAIITNAVAPSSRGKALSFTAIAVAVASCAGPTLGGLLASRFGWNSIFFINIPIGILGTVFSLKFIQKDTAKLGVKFDLPGSALIILALVAILLPLDLLSLNTINVLTAILLLVAGLVLAAIFILHESRIDQPILNLALFKNHIFANSNFAASLFYTAEFMMVFLSPYYLQQQHLLTPSVAGMMMFPMALMMLVFAPIAGTLSDKFDSRLISSIGMAILAAAILGFGGFQANTPIALLIVMFAFVGIGAGLFNTPNNSAVMGSVSTAHRGIAGATLGTMRTIGMVLGEAISATLLSANLSRGTQIFSLQGITGLLLQRSAFSYAQRITCIVAAACALLAMLFSLTRGKKPAGETVAALPMEKE